jgi:hypothetical protein
MLKTETQDAQKLIYRNSYGNLNKILITYMFIVQLQIWCSDPFQNVLVKLQCDDMKLLIDYKTTKAFRQKSVYSIIQFFNDKLSCLFL